MYCKLSLLPIFIDDKKILDHRKILANLNRFDAKPNQNLIAIRREPLVQLNKDSRNIAATASTYGENALIESQQKKMGLIASENEV